MIDGSSRKHARMARSGYRAQTTTPRKLQRKLDVANGFGDLAQEVRQGKHSEVFRDPEWLDLRAKGKKAMTDGNIHLAAKCLRKMQRMAKRQEEQNAQ